VRKGHYEALSGPKVGTVAKWRLRTGTGLSEEGWATGSLETGETG